jgi:hypothetical protein
MEVRPPNGYSGDSSLSLPPGSKEHLLFYDENYPEILVCVSLLCSVLLGLLVGYHPRYSSRACTRLQRIRHCYDQSHMTEVTSTSGNIFSLVTCNTLRLNL